MGLNVILFIPALLGGAYFIYQGVKLALQAKKALQTWQSVQGVVLKAETGRHRIYNSKRPANVTYRPEVTYQYEVNGQSYTCNTLGFGTGTYSMDKAQKMIAPYPQGKSVNVHYDPADPAQAVLEASAHGTLNNFLMGAMFLVLAVLVLIFVPA